MTVRDIFHLPAVNEYIGNYFYAVIVKVTLNLSLSRCMFFAHCSSNFYPIFMKFDKL